EPLTRGRHGEEPQDEEAGRPEQERARVHALLLAASLADERLLHAKAPVNAQGRFYGYVVTPLDMLAQTGGNMALARLLLARGAAISTFGFLEALCHRGRSRADGFALAELFLQHGFDIHSPHEDGTILHRCANTGSVAVAEWLIERGSDVSRRGRMGRTPLHLAAERNRTPAMVEFLVNQGAPRDARDEMGLTPLDVARQHGRTRLFKALTP
ncbi:MAG TPA: ankyrin repeat domain-containing protein, partial [Phycisphaerae bacterium]|nr:ankyrin repeat domain-containing protein [Phycisphaerae bacterium]